MRPLSTILLTSTLILGATLTFDSRADGHVMPVGAAELVADASTLSFVSVKNVHVAENHRFTRLSGQLDADGGFEVAIHLDSVDTKVPIRDERMRTELFEVDRYPLARATGTVNTALLAGLAPGLSTDAEIPFTLELHGTRNEYRAMVRLTRAGDALEVSTTAPILLQAGSVGLDGGVEKLREIAGLTSIGKAVPVYFTLRFAFAAAGAAAGP